VKRRVWVWRVRRIAARQTGGIDAVIVCFRDPANPGAVILRVRTLAAFTAARSALRSEGYLVVTAGDNFTLRVLPAVKAVA
jgi:predicted membrane-bound spermidine synthase